MFKKRYVVIVISLFLLSCGFHGKEIPGRAGNWRVHVGPAGNEFHAPPPEKKKHREKIMLEAKHLLGPYRRKFNFENQIETLGKNPGRPDGSYRFVVLGDSRSNRDLWFSMVKHIDQLDPKPVFVINTGDIVRHGYTKEYLEYYLPPLLETDIPYFVAIGNHDYGTDGDALEFRYLFGENALNYFFDHGRTRYVFMDNVTDGTSHMKTLEWLDAVLKETPEGYHRIVAAHQPVATIKKWAYHSWDKGYSRLFVELMERYSVDHVFFGHIHAYSTMVLNSIPYTISGGGGAGLHHRYGPRGNIHHYIICDVMADGSMEQQVVRFYRNVVGDASEQDPATGKIIRCVTRPGGGCNIQQVRF